tara:strand:+ start:316 stop:891 length:576 start_codon:yes stop_codon:yes gene_type:complete
MAKIRVRSGDTEITASPELERMANDLLNRTTPETKRAIEESIERIYEEARKNWPVRKRQELTGRQLAFAKAAQLQKKGYDRRPAIAAAFQMLRDGELQRKKTISVSNVDSISQDSRGKLDRGILINTGSGEIVGFIRNTAPYAWAIKVGVNSDSVLPLGARVCNELLWKPLKKDANKITRIIAKELTDAMK